MTERQIKASKTLSYALRHRPDEFGLALDAEGWVDIEKVVSALAAGRPPVRLTKGDIEAIIAASDKRRFEICGDRIRATYGHSTADKIKFTPTPPPDVLYHGTARRFLDAITREGLRPMARQYVHLSSDVATAVKVGGRHDAKPVVLVVDAARMSADGVLFYHSGNDGTWMCEAVAPKYIGVRHGDD